MRRPRYKFSGRVDGQYYWTADASYFSTGFEEVVWCSVDWFWGKR